MQRGKKSAASLEVVNHSGITELPRPGPPTELTEEQAFEWQSVVDHLPAEWFPRETHGLLAQYCRHVVAARRVAQLIAGMEARDVLLIDDYDQLLKMQEREGRALSSLATRMRISQQATFHPEKSKGQKVAKKPWE